MTTQEKTWVTVREQAHLLHNIRKPFDHRSPVARYLYHPGDGEPILRRMGDGVEEASDETLYRMTNHAEGQLMSKLKYDRKLLGRLPGPMNFSNVNWLMQHGVESEKNALFRFEMDTVTEANVVRAVMGPMYQPIDDTDLFMHIDPYLKGANVVYDGFGDRSTHLTAIWPNNPLPGGLIPGIHIANSEVGTRSISLGAVLYRQTCGNILPGYYDASGSDAMNYEGGMSIKARFNKKGYRGQMTNQWRFRHVGKEERLVEWIKMAMEDLTIQWDTTVAKWNAGLNTLVSDPLEAIASIHRQASLTQEQLQAALDSWAETKIDFGSCVTGIANTFTLGAQQFSDPEQRYGMQHAGALALGSL